MEKLIGAMVVLGLVAAVAGLLRKQQRAGTLEWPVKARVVLTVPEQVLYQRLRGAFPDLVILSQVALSQILEVRRGKGSQAVFNRISQLVADFVVCRPDFKVLVVVELDDRSHQAPKRVAADARKTAALTAAGVPLWRFNVKAIPSEEALRTALKSGVAGGKGTPERL